MRTRELISLHQPESSGKVKRRHHLSDHLPESFSPAFTLAEQGITLAEQGVHHQEGL